MAKAVLPRPTATVFMPGFSLIMIVSIQYRDVLFGDSLDIKPAHLIQYPIRHEIIVEYYELQGMESHLSSF